MLLPSTLAIGPPPIPSARDARSRAGIFPDEHGRSGGGLEDVVDADVEEGGAFVVGSDGKRLLGSETLGFCGREREA
jgi:hypothetical protein